MIELPILSIDLEEAPIQYILDQVLSSTDAIIIDTISRFKDMHGKLPSAMDILHQPSNTSNLKKTQLYDRLSRLANQGFIAVKLLPRPRRYQVNADTIKEGVQNWLLEQTASLEGLTNELRSIQDFLKRMDTSRLAAAVAEKLSIKSLES